jgi:hypothetical protein
MARKVRSEDFPRADSLVARDYLCRLLADEWFENVERFKREGEEKFSLQRTLFSDELQLLRHELLCSNNAR